MREIKTVFATPLYHAPLTAQGDINFSDIERSCWSIAQDDEAGQNWCKENGYPGYTSYASLTDLCWRFTVFSELQKLLDKHVTRFVTELDWDLGKKRSRSKTSGSTFCQTAARILVTYILIL